jgi:hypothetical protein
VRVGYCPDAGGSYLLPRLIGPTKAAELIYTGRIIDAQEADQLGLLNALVAPEALVDTTMEWATRLANGPTVAIGLAKENIRQNLDASFEDALRNERRSGELCGKTEDHVEGLAATMERREANSHRGVTEYAKLREIIEGAGGFVYAGWCGNAECEQKVKEETKATIRCLPLEEFRSAEAPTRCAVCGQDARAEAIWARAY